MMPRRLKKVHRKLNKVRRSRTKGQKKQVDTDAARHLKKRNKSLRKKKTVKQRKQHGGPLTQWVINKRIREGRNSSTDKTAKEFYDFIKKHNN